MLQEVYLVQLILEKIYKTYGKIFESFSQQVGILISKKSLANVSKSFSSLLICPTFGQIPRSKTFSSGLFMTIKDLIKVEKKVSEDKTNHCFTF